MHKTRKVTHIITAIGVSPAHGKGYLDRVNLFLFLTKTLGALYFRKAFYEVPIFVLVRYCTTQLCYYDSLFLDLRFPVLSLVLRTLSNYVANVRS